MYMWEEEKEEIFFFKYRICTKDKKKELLRIMAWACNLSTKDRKTSISSRPAGST